jgi:hypothetical protein
VEALGGTVGAAIGVTDGSTGVRVPPLFTARGTVPPLFVL